jgi:hypothetical protein
MPFHFHRGEPVNYLRAGTGKAGRNVVERLQDSPPDLPYSGEMVKCYGKVPVSVLLRVTLLTHHMTTRMDNL